jgi:hypothetical protein
MHNVELHVERIKGLPDEAYWQMIEASVELRRQEASAASAYYDGVQQAKQKYLDQLHAIIGAKKLPKYIAAHKQQKEKLRAARQKKVATPESFKEFQRFRKQQIEQSRDLIERLGMDVARVKRLRKDLRSKTAALFKNTIGKGETVKAKRKVKNKSFTAPFNGSSTFVNWFKWFGDPTDNLPDPLFNVSADWQTGEVDSFTFTLLSDASDYDEADVLCRTAMRQWFQMPSLGQVLVTDLTMEVIGTSYSGAVDDEFGYSEIDLTQNWFPYVQVTSPKVSSRVYLDGTLNSHQHKVTDESAPPWSGVWLPAGAQESFARLGPPPDTYVIPGVFKKGTWVLVDFGMEQRNHFVSNDVGVISSNIMQLLVRSVGLSSTGSP